MFTKRKMQFFGISAALFILSIVTIVGFSGCHKNSDSGDFKEVSAGKDTKIAFMSDVHVSANTDGTDGTSAKFDHALKSMYALAPELDAIAVAGDLTQDGTSAQYKNFMKIVEDNKKDNTQLITCMGNYEWYKSGWGIDILKNGLTENIQESYASETGGKVEDNGVVQSYLFRVLNNDTGKYMGSNEANEGFSYEYYRVYLDPAVIGEPDCDYTKIFGRRKSGVSYTIEVSAINPYYKESDPITYAFTKE